MNETPSASAPPLPRPDPGLHFHTDAGIADSGQFEAARASDDQLLSRLALGRGRETALPELFSRHGEASLRLAQRILGDREAGEEAVQDAFLRLSEKAPQWRGECGFRTFFTKMLVNLCRSRRRSGHDLLAKGRRMGSPSQLCGGLAASARVTDVARRLEALDVQQAVREALDQIPEKYREVLILRELEGCSYLEIAEILEASLDEVRIWIFRGRERLRAALEGRASDL